PSSRTSSASPQTIQPPATAAMYSKIRRMSQAAPRSATNSVAELFADTHGGRNALQEKSSTPGVHPQQARALWRRNRRDCGGGVCDKRRAGGGADPVERSVCNARYHRGSNQRNDLAADGAMLLVSFGHHSDKFCRNTGGRHGHRVFHASCGCGAD